MSVSVARFLKFNGVGALGIVVQLGVVHLLLRGSHVSPTVATAVGVTAAVVHNFLWHRLWTWSDRAGRSSAAAAFARFALANGAVSLVGNVVVVAALTRATALGGVTANALAIVVCGLINYAVADRLVFRPMPGRRALTSGLMKCKTVRRRTTSPTESHHACFRHVVADLPVIRSPKPARAR